MDQTPHCPSHKARPLMLAALWAQNPPPWLSRSREAANGSHTVRSLATWLGNDAVLRYPSHKDRPSRIPRWSYWARCRAIAKLSAGEKVINGYQNGSCADARVPPVGSGYFFFLQRSALATSGDVASLLVGMGCADTGEVDISPGTFHIHGDIFSSSYKSCAC